MKMETTDYRTRMAVAVLAALTFIIGALAVPMAAVSADEEEEAAVEEVTVDEETYFLYNDVYYYITNDAEAEGEVAVAGIVYGVLTDYSVEAVLSIDDETSYAVTGILGTEDKGYLSGEYALAQTLSSLLLPTCIVYIGAGAFDGINTSILTIPAILHGDKVSLPNVEGEVSASEYFADYEEYTANFIDVGTAFEVNFHLNVYSKGELSGTNYKEFDYTDTDGVIDAYYTLYMYKGVNNIIVPCLFTRDYFTAVGWTEVKGDPVAEDDIQFDDGAIVTYEDMYDIDDLYAAWAEDSPFEDYPEWMMFATCGIIVVLAIIGLGMLAWRMNKERA